MENISRCSKVEGLSEEQISRILSQLFEKDLDDCDYSDFLPFEDETETQSSSDGAERGDHGDTSPSPSLPQDLKSKCQKHLKYFKQSKKSLRTEIRRLTVENAELQSLNEEKDREISDLKLTVTNHKKIIRVLDEEMKTERAEHEAEIAHFKEAMEEKDKTLTDHKGTIRDLEEMLKIQMEKKEASTRAMKILENETSDLKKELEETQKRLEENNKASEEELASLKATVKDLQEQNTFLEDEMVCLKEGIEEELKIQLQKNEMCAEEITQLKSANEKEILYFKTTVKNLQELNTFLEDEMACLKEDMEEELKDREAEMTRLRSTIENQEAENSKLRAALSDSERSERLSRSNHEEKFQLQRRVIEAKEEEVTLLQNKEAELQEQLKESHTEIIQLRSQVSVFKRIETYCKINHCEKKMLEKAVEVGLYYKERTAMLEEELSVQAQRNDTRGAEISMIQAALEGLATNMQETDSYFSTMMQTHVPKMFTMMQEMVEHTNTLKMERGQHEEEKRSLMELNQSLKTTVKDMYQTIQVYMEREEVNAAKMENLRSRNRRLEEQAAERRIQTETEEVSTPIWMERMRDLRRSCAD